MIPKIIHYCWFGGHSLPDSVLLCIESWKRFLPDYEIKCWSENNFDISSIKFAQQAYLMGKYAFVADVCRMYALYTEGGIYLDTDMLFIKPIEKDFLNSDAFIGWENDFEVAAGIIGSKSGGEFVHDVYNRYKILDFEIDNNNISANLVIPNLITELLVSKGLKIDGRTQMLDKYIYILSAPHFYPKDYKTGYTEISSETIAIHLYDATWHSEQKKMDALKSQYEMRLFYAIKDLKKHFSTGDILSMCYRALNKKPLQLISAVFCKLLNIIKNKSKRYN